MVAQSKRQEASASQTRTTATHFVFEHKIFSVQGARFALTGVERLPSLLLDVGEHEASIHIESLYQEFSITPESEDGMLLDQGGEGLRFVKDIRPGDTIPRELLDGSASWSIDDGHRILAKNKILTEIAIIGKGKGEFKVPAAELARFHGENETKMWVQSGLDTVGAALGFGSGRPQKVLEIIESLARELAYIEALRDRYEFAQGIIGKLAQVAKYHPNERHFLDEIQRCKILITPTIKEFRKMFASSDIILDSIVGTLRTVDDQQKFVRDVRDELHQKMLIWDELIECWSVEVSADAKRNREVIKFTYRFVAENFPQDQSWS